jgi:hypothetical protein
MLRTAAREGGGDRLNLMILDFITTFRLNKKGRLLAESAPTFLQALRLI